MSQVNNLQDWIDTHIGGDCNEASDCMILLAQVLQKELNNKGGITGEGDNE
jgi:hypothetical protein